MLISINEHVVSCISHSQDLPGIAPVASEPGGTTPLLAAAAGAHTALVRLLLQRGATDACDAEGFSPLLHAVDTAKNTKTALAILSGLGGDAARLAALVNRGNHASIRPLHAAAEHGLKDVLLALIKAGAEVDAKTETGDTALIKAAGKGDMRLEIVRILLVAGADPLATDARNNTALDVALLRSK